MNLSRMITCLTAAHAVVEKKLLPLEPGAHVVVASPLIAELSHQLSFEFTPKHYDAIHFVILVAYQSGASSPECFTFEFAHRLSHLMEVLDKNET